MMRPRRCGGAVVCRNALVDESCTAMMNPIATMLASAGASEVEAARPNSEIPRAACPSAVAERGRPREERAAAVSAPRIAPSPAPARRVP
jgi:hypothetical protein